MINKPKSKQTLSPALKANKAHKNLSQSINVYK